MYKYLLAHEKYIKDILSSGESRDWSAVRSYHKVQIAFLQHERLIHLLVTLAFALLLIASCIATVFYFAPVMIVLTSILMVVEVFYVVHYYRLENGVQRWYSLYNALCDKEAGK